MKPFIACGLMSGTSRDGIDVALVEIAGKFPENRITLIHAETVGYPPGLARLLGDLGASGGESRRGSLGGAGWAGATHVAAADFWVGEAFGRAAGRAFVNAGLTKDDVCVIGSHGQTIFHFPEGLRVGRTRGIRGIGKTRGKAVRATLQVGNGAVIARIAGVPTVSDFRSADLAAGGEGAPLVPIYDYVALRNPSLSRVAINIGGIANLTAIPAGGAAASVVSFDTGPGNCLLDLAVEIATDGRRKFDNGGALARKGDLDPRLLRRLLAHPYFKRRPPKSTGWEEFGRDLLRELWPRAGRTAARQAGKRSPDRSRAVREAEASRVLRTLTEATAESIAAAVSDFVAPRMWPDEAVVTGGGSRNTFLLERLSKKLGERFPEIVVDRGEAFGIDSDAKEACAFAYLAYLHLACVPANLSSQAAGLPPAILGCLYPVPGRLRPELAARLKC